MPFEPRLEPLPPVFINEMEETDMYSPSSTLRRSASHPGFMPYAACARLAGDATTGNTSSGEHRTICVITFPFLVTMPFEPRLEPLPPVFVNETEETDMYSPSSTLRRSASHPDFMPYVAFARLSDNAITGKASSGHVETEAEDADGTRIRGGVKFLEVGQSKAESLTECNSDLLTESLAAQAAQEAAVWKPKGLPVMPQFSSLKGGYAPKTEGFSRLPHTARPALERTEMDSNDVNQKAREMLHYLQRFDKAPLQRLLSSREGTRSKLETRMKPSIHSFNVPSLIIAGCLQASDTPTWKT
eukprot:g26809.t1